VAHNSVLVDTNPTLDTEEVLMFMFFSLRIIPHPDVTVVDAEYNIMCKTHFVFLNNFVQKELICRLLMS
jgi:hypothetical protein